MVSRSGKMVAWKMAQGCEDWLGCATMENIKRIYMFLKEQTVWASLEDRSNPAFTYKSISKGTGLSQKAVSLCCQKMAYRVPQIVKIKRGLYFVAKEKRRLKSLRVSLVGKL